MRERERERELGFVFWARDLEASQQRHGACGQISGRKGLNRPASCTARSLAKARSNDR